MSGKPSGKVRLLPVLAETAGPSRLSRSRALLIVAGTSPSGWVMNPAGLMGARPDAAPPTSAPERSRA